MNSPSTEIGPGFWAFVAFFFPAIALWIIVRSMFTRLRRMRIAEAHRVEEERAERARTDASDALRHRPVERQGSRDEVRDEGQDGEGVEDLVEPEPPR